MKKTIKILTMAALALMTVACSNDDNELIPQKPTDGIPFTATISSSSATVTRTLTDNNGKIVEDWEVGDKVALIYNNNGTNVLSDDVEVTEVDNDGTATIKGTLKAGTTNGTEVTIIYPLSAVDETTLDVKSDLFTSQAQLGTLEDINAKYDVRKGVGHLEIPTDGSSSSLADAVKLEYQNAIFKMTVTALKDGGSLSPSELNITDKDNNLVTKVTPGTNVFYVALPTTVSYLWFETTIGGVNYINHATVNLSAKFYQSALKLATVGDVVLSNGKFAKEYTTGSNGAKAVIAYVGKVDKYFDRFIAIALTDIYGSKSWNAALTAVNTYASQNPIVIDGTTYNENTINSYYDIVTGNISFETREGDAEKGWRLPSVTDWHYVFEGLTSEPDNINDYCSNEDIDIDEEIYWTSTQKDNDNAWTYNFFVYSNNFKTYKKTSYEFVRAVFAY